MAAHYQQPQSWLHLRSPLVHHNSLLYTCAQKPAMNRLHWLQSSLLSIHKLYSSLCIHYRVAALHREPAFLLIFEAHHPRKLKSDFSNQDKYTIWLYNVSPPQAHFCLIPYPQSWFSLTFRHEPTTQLNRLLFYWTYFNVEIRPLTGLLIWLLRGFF